jgi:pyruvate dehydrogenase E2 component (dihydrolipoamide acetyltransferase)
MAELLLMPEVATGTTSAVLSAWPMPEGSAYKAGDILAILETDKAVVDVEAEADGIMHTHLVSAGTDVNIGVPIALTPRWASRLQINQRHYRNWVFNPNRSQIRPN